MSRMRSRGRWWRLILPLVFALTVAGCSTEDDEDGDATQPPAATATVTVAAPTATVAPTVGTLTQINGQAISDGICLAIIPDGWVDDGTGRGSTLGGGRFVLFGGRVANDAAWQAAVDAVATPTGGRSIQSDERTADAIHVVFADGRGFEYRKRFASWYCDLTVTSSVAIPDEQQAIWPAIIDSLEPVAP